MKTDFQNLYDLVWRTDFGMPGYAAIDLPDHDSFALRRLMIEVQRAFTPEACRASIRPILGSSARHFLECPDLRCELLRVAYPELFQIPKPPADRRQVARVRACNE